LEAVAIEVAGFEGALLTQGGDNSRDDAEIALNDKPTEFDPGMRDPRFDIPVLALGSLISAALSVGLGTAFLYISRTNTGPDVGPTAATLNDAFSTLFGAALGLLVGTGLTAFFARRGPRITTGVLAGVLAYAAVLIPVVVATGPRDVSAGESFGFALVLGVPLGICVLIGAIVGAGFGTGRGMTIGRRQLRRRAGRRP